MDYFTLTTRTLDREFFGPSFNGEAFLPLLNRLNFEDVLSRKTWEGYSVLDIVHHVAYWKYALLAHLDLAEQCGTPPFELKNFPKALRDFNTGTWGHLLAYLQTIHSVGVQAISELRVEDLENEMEGLDCKLGDFLVWYCTHDSYHSAQIRNMGLNALKNPFTPV